MFSKERRGGRRRRRELWKVLNALGFRVKTQNVCAGHEILKNTKTERRLPPPGGPTLRETRRRSGRRDGLRGAPCSSDAARWPDSRPRLIPHARCSEGTLHRTLAPGASLEVAACPVPGLRLLPHEAPPPLGSQAPRTVRIHGVFHFLCVIHFRPHVSMTESKEIELGVCFTKRLQRGRHEAQIPATRRSRR